MQAQIRIVASNREQVIIALRKTAESLAKGEFEGMNQQFHSQIGFCAYFEMADSLWNSRTEGVATLKPSTLLDQAVANLEEEPA